MWLFLQPLILSSYIARKPAGAVDIALGLDTVFCRFELSLRNEDSAAIYTKAQRGGVFTARRKRLTCMHTLRSL